MSALSLEQPVVGDSFLSVRLEKWLGHAIEIRAYRSGGALHVDWWYDSRRVSAATAEALQRTFPLALSELIQEGIMAEQRVERALASGYELDTAPPTGLALVTPTGTRPLRRLDDSDEIDSVVLDRALAQLPPHELTFQHGVDHVERAVRTGAADAGVLLRPVSVEQIARTAHAREKMPNA